MNFISDLRWKTTEMSL